MADTDVLAVVWGETNRVTSKDGSNATLARLEAVVAKLAALAKKRGFDSNLSKLPPPRVGSQQALRYQKMMVTVEAVEGGTWSGAALPARAAIWEITINGSPRLDQPLPKAVSWITDQDVASGGDFVVGDGSDGRLYRLFETEKAASDHQLPFASAVTGSGMPKPEAANPFRKIAWAIGITAAVVFVLGGALSVWTGRSLSDARNLLVTTNPTYQYELLTAVTEFCAVDYKAFPDGAQSAVCGKLLEGNELPSKNSEERYDFSQAVSVLADAKSCPAAPSKDGCNTIWRAAIVVGQKHSWKAGLFQFLNDTSASLSGVTSAAGSASVLVSFLMLVCGIAGLTVALGLGTKQRVAGVWIDTRNRVSLARAQVTLWTAVALAGYTTFALFNVGFAGIAGAAAASAGGGALGISTFGAFPAIPASVAAALGIAAVSPMLSALILPTKDATGNKVDLAIRGSDGDLRRRGAPFFGAESEGLEKRASPRLASIADIFMGEEIANADTVDVSRLQNVVITTTLVLGFFSILVAMTTVGADQLIGAKAVIFTSLPELGATFTALLVASHTTYLISKAHDAQPLNPLDQQVDS
ncbi:hypothetical protein [Mesorhizobium sp. M0522]|uniref:hypothetical protein n=1 Tax=Mesorhizobium sp. M0522 TaxID=2956958 RepID=UPI003337A435